MRRKCIEDKQRTESGDSKRKRTMVAERPIDEGRRVGETYLLRTRKGTSNRIEDSSMSNVKIRENRIGRKSKGHNVRNSSLIQPVPNTKLKGGR